MSNPRPLVEGPLDPEHDAAATLSVARVLDEIRGQIFAEAA